MGEYGYSVGLSVDENANVKPSVGVTIPYVDLKFETTKTIDITKPISDLGKSVFENRKK